jgi:MFS family permease
MTGSNQLAGAGLAAPALSSTVEKTSAVPYDRAWGVLIGASLCLFCGIPSVIYYTMGLFVPEIIADTHWPAAAVAAAIGPAALIASCTLPILGRMSDRFGVRPVALIGGPLFGGVIALLGFASNSPTSFAILTVVMFVFAFAGSPIAYAQALTGWFDKRRGLALGIMFSCGAIGIAVWPIFASKLIAALGWRQAYMAMGATSGSVIFLSAVFLLRNPPAAPAAALGRQGHAPGLLVREALRTARFWKTAAIFLLMSAVLGGMAVEFPVVLRREGADAHAAAAIMPVIGLAMFAGRMLLGFVLDRWFAPHVTIGIAIVSMLSFVLLLASTGRIALTLAAAGLGFGIGTEYAVAAYLTSRAFGFRAYGAIYALITFATGIGLSAGPAIIGVSLVKDVPLPVIFGSSIAVLVVSIGLLLTLRRSDLPFGAR